MPAKWLLMLKNNLSGLRVIKYKQRDKMNTDRLKFRTPYYLPNPDDINEFVGFAYWDAITGRPNMMVVWGNDEQCTGLRDINGNLIYEGDIIKLDTPDSDVTAVVIWQDGCFCPGDDDPFGDSTKWEIIGNIHEQKEQK